MRSPLCDGIYECGEHEVCVQGKRAPASTDPAVSGAIFGTAQAQTMAASPPGRCHTCATVPQLQCPEAQGTHLPPPPPYKRATTWTGTGQSSLLLFHTGCPSPALCSTAPYPACLALASHPSIPDTRPTTRPPWTITRARPCRRLPA